MKQEIQVIEEDVKEGLNIIQPIISSFPNNVVLIQFFASLSNNLLYVQILRRRIQIIENRLSSVDATNDEILEVTEDLGMELGKAIEAKISIRQILNRLRELS
ncbi:MAG: restriction endonuclease subunit S [Cyanobacteria bacterium J083]|nr:MAG: restriction endonuclease subunit S [Cyanobacteria bacterium J083]